MESNNNVFTFNLGGHAFELNARKLRGTKAYSVHIWKNGVHVDRVIRNKMITPEDAAMIAERYVNDCWKG